MIGKPISIWRPVALATGAQPSTLEDFVVERGASRVVECAIIARRMRWSDTVRRVDGGEMGGSREEDGLKGHLEGLKSLNEIRNFMRTASYVWRLCGAACGGTTG
jgi:hypothetical protein